MAYEYLATGYFRDSLEICDRLIELDPLSSSAYLRRAQTLRALGRRAEARKNLQHAFELGAALAGSILASDYIVAGEYELAADWLERSESPFFSGREEIDAFFGNVLKPDTGRQYLVDWVDSKSRNAADFEIRHTAYFWLTYFAYLDELWERTDDLDMATDALWDNTDTLISSGFVHRRKEMMAHPRFLPFRMSDTSVELWEARGAPDFCRKDSGEWVCE
jgi:tetratricopeptide (TPR) repeat protein